MTPASEVLYSFAAVAVAEVMDKTMLIAFALAAHYCGRESAGESQGGARRALLSILLGILVATIVNHGASAALGEWISEVLSETRRDLLVGALFLFCGIWMLIPDSDGSQRFGGSPFLTTTVVFFLAEIGDKTQVLTIGLAAKFEAPLLVTLGSTMGIMVTSGSAVIFGGAIGPRIPVRTLHALGALAFVATGCYVLSNAAP